MIVKNFINGQITTGTEPIDPISGVSRGLYINSVLSGNSSSDTLVGLDINPSYSGTAGNYFGLRVSGDTIFATSGGTQVFRTASDQYASLGSSDFGAYFQVTSKTRTISPGRSSAEFVIGNYSDSKFSLFSYDGASAWTERFRLAGQTGNVLIGTTTDGGYKLDVNGTVRVQGQLYAASDIVAGTIQSRVNQNLVLSAPWADSQYIILQTYVNSANVAWLKPTDTVTRTSGGNNLLYITETFAPTAGDATSTMILLRPTINQTGGASGTTRGIYINPILTSSYDFRAIETTVGNVNLNIISGSTNIGTSGSTGFKLYVSGSTLLRGSGTTSASYALATQNSSGGTTMVVNDAGNMLIGTTTDNNYRLYVNGLARFYGSTTAGAIFGSGDVINLGGDAYMLATSANGNAGYTANRSSTSYYASIDLVTAANISTGWSMQIRPNTTYWSLNNRLTDTTVMAAFTTGNFGIGTTTDAGFKLDVNGTTRFSNSITGTSATFTGTINGVVINYSSAGGTVLGGPNTTRGTNSVALGYGALYFNSGSNNVGIGFETNGFAGSASNCIMIGVSAGRSNTASNNIGIGISTLSISSGQYNIAIGNSSQTRTQTGNSNTSIGYQSGYANSYNNSVSLGYYALRFNSTTIATFGSITGGTGYVDGYYPNVGLIGPNTSLSYFDVYANITISGGSVVDVQLVPNKGGTNVAVGEKFYTQSGYVGGSGSGFFVEVGSVTTGGGDNVAVGYQSLMDNYVGYNNTAIGSSTKSNRFSNNILIGKGAEASGNNQIVFGSSGTTVGPVSSYGFELSNIWKVKVNGTDYQIPLGSLVTNNILKISGSLSGTSTAQLIGTTLVSTGHSQTLIGLDIQPNFNRASYTGTTAIALRVSGGTQIIGSGSTGTTLSIFSVDGASGRLFDVTDDFSNSLFSVNTSSGVPVIEAFANNSVVMGTYGSNTLVVSGTSVGIGKTSPSYKLDINGDINVAERILIESYSSATTQTTSVISATTTNSGIVISPNGTGAITVTVPDGTSIGGNSRGSYSVDLQRGRLLSTNVASGNYSSIVGGYNNASTGDYSTSFGKDSNSYLYGQQSFSSGYFASVGDSQHSTVVLRGTDTGGDNFTFYLTLDGTSGSNYIIPSGDNRTWGVKVLYSSVCTVRVGGNPNLGDSSMGEYMVLINKSGGTTSIIDVTSGIQVASSTFSTSRLTFELGSNQDLKVKYTAPSMGIYGNYIRAVAKLTLIEIGY
jgi:hypothetical protein